MGLLCSSCAAIRTGRSDNISFESNPSGAIVYIDGEEICTTPCQAIIRRQPFESNMVQVKLDGYRVETRELKKSFNAVTLLNFLLGGGILFAIDLMVGAPLSVGLVGADLIIGGTPLVGSDLFLGSIIKYDPKQYNFNLVKANNQSLNSDERIKKIEIDTKKKLVTVTGSQE